ncbi:hypothetical protein KGF56_003862 [Candida oxycetoniae]|uniref:Alpha/beta hydrolase fold-3 domain-containing protein n=1 Tax=Candida oxycetoniae TaxID=497107 RepID=A0AAI9SUW9_9ASCO|nr:uncharacterized protein KGF56_003862 [Candida oxycetoniae]KAI3403274.2 hypothetical protein KGF56_003862 [Candida oxycetoniae]
MISLRGLFILLSIPFKLLLVLLKYPFVGGVNKKFKNDLKNSLKLQLYKTALSTPVKDAALLSILSNHFLINKLIKLLYPSLTKPLNKYGQNYDDQSFWLVEAQNRSKDDPILLYLHGGGYYLETMPQQLESLLGIYHFLEPEKKKTLSILHFDYKLACRGHIVTTQLYQLAKTYEKLTVEDGNTNIIFMGDSAGGHLAVTFLQYLKQLQNKNTIWPKTLVLISPWVKLFPDVHQFSTKGWSYFDNSNYDMIQHHYFLEEPRQKAIVGHLDHRDMLISPGNLPYKHSDWEDIPSLNDSGYSVFVIVGEHEVFRDDILEWCQYALKSPLLKQEKESDGSIDVKIHEYKNDGDRLNGAYVDVIIEPWGVHDSALFFENEIAKRVKQNPNLKFENLDAEEFFGIVRIVINGVKKLYPNLTNLNNYGKKYDKQSIWLVEAPNRTKEKNDPIVIYLHGGGYVHETRAPQIESVLSIFHLLEAEKRDKLSILHLDYKLACRGHTVTTQLYQLAEVYQKLAVQDGNKNIILMGDSAGGNLAITFLQYLKQLNNKSIPWPKSLVLISPWVKIFADPHQFQSGWAIFDNRNIDMVPYRPHNDMRRRKALLGDLSASNMLVSPGNLPYKYKDWEDIPSLNDSGYSVFVILGENEVFVDDILEWCKFALKCPLIKPAEKSKGIFQSEIHEYQNTNNGAYVDVAIEPWGVHVASLFFENVIAAKLEGDLQLKLQSVDCEEFFGIVRDNSGKVKDFKSSFDGDIFPSIYNEDDFVFKIKTIIGTSARSHRQLAVQGNLVAYTASGGIVVSRIDKTNNLVVSQRFFCANVSYKSEPLSSSLSSSGATRVSAPDAYLKMIKKDALAQPEELLKDSYGYLLNSDPEEVYGNSCSPTDFDDCYSSATTPTSMMNSSSSPSKLKNKVRSVSCLAISPNKKLLAVGETGYQPRVLLFSLAPNSHSGPIIVIYEHSFGINSLSFSPDSKYLCSLGLVNDGCIHIWKLGLNTAILQASNRCSNIVHKMIWHENTIITLGLRFIKLWNFENGAGKPLVLKGKNVTLGNLMNSNFVGASILNEDEMLIIANSNQLLLLKLNFNSPKLVALESPSLQFDSLAVDHESGVVWLGGETDDGLKSIPIDQLKTRELNQLSNGLVQTNSSSSSSSSSSKFPTKLHSQFNSGVFGIAPKESTNRNGALVDIVDFSSTHLICLSGDETIRVYNKSEGRQDSPLAGAVISDIAGFKKSHTKEFLVFSKFGKVEKFLPESSELKPLLNFQLPSNGITPNTLTAIEKIDESTFVLGDKYGSLYIVEIQGNPSEYEIKYRTQAHVTIINEVIFFQFQDKNLICSISRDRMIQLFVRDEESKIWDLWQTVPTHNGNLLQVKYHDNRLYVCSSDRSISIHVLSGDPKLALIKTKIITLRSTPTAMAIFDNDLVVSTVDRQVLIFDNANNNFELRRSLKLMNEKLNESIVIASFVKFRHLLIAWSADKSIRCFNYSTGKPIGVTWGHSDSLLGLYLRTEDVDVDVDDVDDVDDDDDDDDDDGGGGGINDEAELISIGSDGCLFSWIITKVSFKEDYSRASPFDKAATSINNQEEDLQFPAYSRVTRKVLSITQLAPSSSSSKDKSSEKINKFTTNQASATSVSSSFSFSSSPTRLTTATQRRIDMRNKSVAASNSTSSPTNSRPTSPMRSKTVSGSSSCSGPGSGPGSGPSSVSPKRSGLSTIEKAPLPFVLSKLDSPLKSPTTSSRRAFSPKNLPDTSTSTASATAVSKSRPFVHMTGIARQGSKIAPPPPSSSSPSPSFPISQPKTSMSTPTITDTCDRFVSQLNKMLEHADQLSLEQKSTILDKLDKLRKRISPEIDNTRDVSLEEYSDKLIAIVEQKMASFYSFASRNVRSTPLDEEEEEEEEEEEVVAD